jgi:hypothetical protein
MQPVSIVWTHEQNYRDQLTSILGRSTTFPVNELVGAPGFCPNVWITQGASDVVHRSAYPCPDHLLCRNRLRTLHLLLNHIWSKDHLEAFAGAYTKTDILVEQMSIYLILDSGEPAMCIFVFILTDEKLLITQLGDFHLGVFYWADRVLIRSALSFAY